MSRRMIAVAVLCITALVAPVATASVEPKPDTIRWNTVEKFGREKVQKYAHLHRKWTKRAGRQVVGRQLVKFGMPKKGDGKRVATRKEWRRTMAVFDRWEHPPPPPAPAPVLSSTQPSASSSYYGGTGQYAIPTDIVMCESGGDYNAVNPSSGARGAYQLMPEHYESGGACSDLTWAPAGQDTCAARLWAGGAGRSNWVC